LTFILLDKKGACTSDKSVGMCSATFHVSFSYSEFVYFVDTHAVPCWTAFYSRSFDKVTWMWYSNDARRLWAAASNYYYYFCIWLPCYEDCLCTAVIQLSCSIFVSQCGTKVMLRSIHFNETCRN
jgi:hypothetical protein